MLPAGSVFKEDVRSALRYVETVTCSKFHYEGVLIDEERVFGIENSRAVLRTVGACCRTVWSFHRL
ncbi:hypothetical protein BGW80DRAFT_1299383 [Lactifluus volemus]|nr:hypothetical protein BGW80DRAFT_1299383 [Lactifluus volemus]